MKHEYKKHEKTLYCPKETPQLLNVPKQKFLCIKGQGDPNKEDFSERVTVLYALSYAIRMIPKSGFTPSGYFEYTVYPLEGIWDLTEKGRQLTYLDKNELLYTIMIRQPDFVSDAIVEKAFEITHKKKPHPLLNEVYFTEIEDGLSVQILHTGSYDTEQQSFNKMMDFINQNNYERRLLTHREIYLSDMRKTETSKLKTILRYTIDEKLKLE